MRSQILEADVSSIDARRDIFKLVQENNLDGTITRVRYVRVVQIRLMLGLPLAERDVVPDAAKYAEDDVYLKLDIALHMVSRS